MMIIIIIIIVNKRPDTCNTFTPSKFNSLRRCSPTIAKNPRGVNAARKQDKTKNKNYYTKILLLFNDNNDNNIMMYIYIILLYYFIGELIFRALRTVEYSKNKL